MPSTVPRNLPTPQRKNLEMGLRQADRAEAKANLKPLAEASEQARRKRIGRVVERALEIAGYTKQQAARGMGYGDDQAPVSRWIAGVERPLFDRLLLLGARMDRGLAMAWCEDAGSTVRMSTVVTIDHYDEAVGR